MKQLKAIGYGRTSSEDKKEEKISIPLQKAAFEQACKKHGWQNFGWHEDRDTSGRCPPVGYPLEQYDTATTNYLANKPKGKRTRKGLTQALQIIKDQKIDVFFVRDVTRYCRPAQNALLGQYLRTYLSENNCSFYSENEGGIIDYTKLETLLMMTMQETMENHSITTKSKQSKNSRNEKRDEGKIYCKPDCLGFRYSGRHYVKPITEELKIVRQIFEAYLSGQSVNQIAVTLNAKKVPSYNGGKIWYRRSITQCLSRCWYAGKQISSDGVLIDSEIFKPHAVITEDEFKDCQERLNDNGHGKRRESRYSHPLAGFVKCGYCNAAMVTTSAPYKGGKQRYYTCGNVVTKTAKPECNKSVIRECMSEPANITQSEGYLADTSADHEMAGLIEALYPWTIAGYLKQLQETDITPELKAKRQSLKADIKALADKVTSRYQDYEAGILPKSAFIQLSNQAKTQEESLNAELAKTEKQITEAATQTKITFDDTSKLERMNHRQYTDLLKKAVTAVYAYSDRIEIQTTDNQTVTLPRIRIRNGRQLPNPVIMLQQRNPKDTTLTGQVIVRYDYPKDQLNESTFVYASQNFKVLLDTL